MENVIDITSEEYLSISTQVNNEEIKTVKYTISDCIIVRTTTGFPINGIVETPYNNMRVIMNGTSQILDAEINSKVREYCQKTSENILKIKKLTELKYRNLRPSTHFCINGLVTNVEGNDFTNREYVVFSELEPQLKNGHIESLRIEDIYFSDNVLISKILMSKQQYEKIKDDPKYKNTLENLQVFIYDSSKLTQQEAVTKVLHILGKDAFLINSYGLSNQEFDYSRGEIIVNNLQLPNKASQMTKLIYDLCHGKEIPNKTFNFEPHMGSDIQAQENMFIFEEGVEEDLNHMFYLIENSSINTERKEELKEAIYSSINNNLQHKLKMTAKKLISELSIEEIINLTQNFNQEFLQSVETGQKMQAYYDTARVDKLALMNMLLEYNEFDDVFDNDYGDFFDEFDESKHL